MATNSSVGARLLVAQIDELAKEPSRVWASVPVDDKDLAKGFRDVTYSEFANSINRTALWLKHHLPEPTQPFETIAYSGPKDIRYPIIAVAAAKLGRKLLLPSPFAAIDAQAHLVQASACRVFLHGKPLAGIIGQVLSKTTNNTVSALEIPEVFELLKDEPPPPVSFTKTWEQAQNDPWLIFHTSGTTGLPKLVTYSHKMMASLDAAELMPDASDETMNNHFRNRRWYTPLPSLHFVGMTVSLQFPVFLGGVVVIGPPGAGPTTPNVAEEVIKRANAQGVMLPPALIDGLCETPAGLESLRQLDYIYFAGAPMLRPTAEKLLPYVPVKPGMGSTEAGAYFLRISGDEDWEYCTPRPGMGLEFQHRTGDLYEAVFVRHPEVERWQQVFHLYPDLQEFPTHDIYTQHPSKKDMWKYVGRTDDMVPFSHGEKLYVANIEAEIAAADSDISAVLIGGQGRPKPFVLVEWKGSMSDKSIQPQKLQPILDKVNERLSDLVKLRSKLVIFADSSKPLVRTIKGSVSRKESEKLYQDEINNLYHS
ncbi:AMP-binding enzyme [Aaosphaeria arxii CBS 175.79]|uniref:AMP-binding enzyme n=1 Tax=Aaosphaeria arxii CBS 175.79 TaxID=1450172 RepID=A0A6A5XY83_9PLEO|nr:AMP-binding enzyme [Aaosphaeria arxii CBS 175.79]KAF2017909.1 AMP-binding enzyme [Aaosphaeria arxii CBS 175.79]